MLNKICFIIIKFSVWFLKKIKLDISAFDKIIYCIGDVKIGQNKEKYVITKDLTETEVKIFSQNGEDGIKLELEITESPTQDICIINIIQKVSS